ncbi:MAG: GAF domain-containing protein [Pseudomonadota bacterium]
MTFAFAIDPKLPSEQFYEALLSAAESLLRGEPDRVANAANLSALIYSQLSDLNWAGFYLFDGRELVVGPFQGLPACVRIPLGKGVCGTAAAERRTLRVDDVDQFPGHIACDSASRSELVIPLIKDDELLGVLDLDSPKRSRFMDEDARGLGRLAELWVAAS